MDAIRGAQCKVLGPQEGAEGGGWAERSLERHPCLRTSRLRPRGGDMATTPRPREPRRHPFPGRHYPPAPRGRGLLPLPTLPALPGPHSPPAAVAARRPGPRHSRLPRLQRLLPCGVLPHPLPAERAERDPSRAGPSGLEHVGPLRPEPEATPRPTSRRCWSLSRL